MKAMVVRQPGGIEAMKSRASRIRSPARATS